MHKLAKLDQRFVWHPFTQMLDWMKTEPIVIVKGKGAELTDAHGRKFLDANASIWTNLHGHNHPKINSAVHRQLRKIAHSSALGFANEPASLLAKKLVVAANNKRTETKLSKVFFSDDGSTALEVALKQAYQYSRRTQKSKMPKFISLEGGYHGDTVGAVSLGHIDLFHKTYSGLLFKSDKVASPYCYRCKFNRAKPDRDDSRNYRQCNWECLDRAEQKFSAQKGKGEPYSAFVFEPLMQGAAGMVPQPRGWLKRITQIARGHGTLLIADEVMTGFGRTGKLFACQHENVEPDFLCLAKGLTGGYLPMAATLTTRAVFDAFLGKYSEFKTFFHGHSFTGNQLGASAALASLEILQSKESIIARKDLEKVFREELNSLWRLSKVGDIRQAGLIVGIELVKDWRTRQPFDLRERAGIRVCETMAKRGVLTRPIGNVIVLMPPYCTTPLQLKKMIAATRESIAATLGN